MQTYETIDLNEYVQTGAGGTAVSYTHNSGKTLVKLYNPGFEADRAKAEFLTARTVFELGIPTPEPYRLVTDGERFGAEYEMVPNKRSFTRIISQEPERLQEISILFAHWAKKLHETAANTHCLRSYKQVISQFYKEKNMVPEEFKQRAMAFLEKVPEPETLLHGDLQIGNIITDGKRTLWIDVGEFSYGCPEWDLAMIWIMSQRMTEERADRLFHLKPEQLKEHWDFFLPAYLGTSDPQALGAYVKRLMPFYALKVPYMYDMAFHASLPEASLQYIIQMIG
jgi:uncharacterized protein (TIGR02172 family)